MINGMKIIIGMATMNSREYSIKYTIKSLQKQTVKPDEVIIYNNDQNEYDATDNAKFYYFEQKHNEPVYFLTMDDDIIYPENYIENTINMIEKYKCIVTYHGREINHRDVNYYTKHKCYSCLRSVLEDKAIAIPGTGVSAFRSDYFKPEGIFYNDNKRMSDILFGLEAQKQNKQIVLLKHESQWIGTTMMDLENSCFFKERGNETQNKLTNIIYDNKYNVKEQLIVYIFHYNRRDFLDHQIQQANKFGIDYIILDDGSDFINEYTNNKIIKLNNEGKENFYKKWQWIYDHFNTTDKKFVMIIPEDFYNIDYERVINLLKTNDHKTVNWIYKMNRDHRIQCWNNREPTHFNSEFRIDYFLDCEFLTNKTTFNNIGRIDKVNSNGVSSGVGKWYTNRMDELGYFSYCPMNPFIYHGEHESVMHETERKKNPLISLFINEEYKNKRQNKL